jgi:hypothetical protein
MKLALFTVFLIALSGVSSRSVYLHIDNEEFVNVLVGNPGSVLTFRLSFQCNYTLKMFSYPNSFSLTHVKYPYEVMSGNIIVYLGHQPYRFHVDFDPLARSTTEPEYDYTYHGVLCLAQESQLWLHWTRFTLSPRALMLGEFSSTMHRNYPHPYLIDLTKVNRIVPYLNDEVVTHEDDDEDDLLFFQLDLSNRFTTIPSRYYHHLENFSFGLEPHGYDGRMMLEEADRTRSLPNGFDEWLITTDSYNNTHVILGSHAIMRSFTLYVDWVTEVFIIRPSHDHLFPLLREHRFTSFFSLFAMLVMFFWITDHSLNHLYFSTKELYCLAFTGITAYVFLHVLAYERYIDFFTFTHHHFWIFAISLSIFFLFGAFLALISFKTNKFIRIRFSLVESSLAIIIWMLLVPTRGNTLEQLTCLLVNSYYPISSSFSFLVIKHSKHPLDAVILLAVALFSNFFYIYFTIIPILKLNWFGFPKLALSVIIIWCSIVGLILTLLHSEFITNHIQKRIHKSKQRQPPPLPPTPEPPRQYQYPSSSSGPVRWVFPW